MGDPARASESLRRAIAAAGRGLVEREAVVELVALAAVAGEHLLIVGPPGTAKSEAVRRISRRLGGRYFEYLLGRFTEPSEIFGPVNLAKLRAGAVETDTTGMLPEAEVAFLDEVFLGSTAILNTLLGILNERTFSRGHTRLQCPLRVCVGASNKIPEDEQLAAFADRFLVRAFVEPVGESRLEELLEGAWSLGADVDAAAGASLAAVDELAAVARAADVAPVRPALAHALRTLRSAGVVMTDRRAARVQRLVAAAAVIAGRAAPTDADLWTLVYAVPTEAGQRIARDVLRDQLAASENRGLPVAAAEGSLGPAARAARIVERGNALLDDKEQQPARRRLTLEALAREIDAGFARDSLPKDLGELRAKIVERLAEPKTTTTSPS